MTMQTPERKPRRVMFHAGKRMKPAPSCSLGSHLGPLTKSPMGLYLPGTMGTCGACGEHILAVDVRGAA